MTGAGRDQPLCEQGSVFSTSDLDDQHTFDLIVVCTLAGLSVLKGLHAPLAWAYTQAQVDYTFGFVRRGFVGATFGALLGLRHFAHFCAFSYGVLALTLVLLFVLGSTSRLVEAVPGAKLPALLASSFALTFLVHLAGYTDVLLLCVATGFLLLRNAVLQRFMLPFVIGVGLLIHENFLLLFLPVVLLEVALQGRSARAALSRSGGLWAAVCGGAFSLGCTFAINAFGTIGPAKAEAIRHLTEQKVDATLNEGFWGVLTTSFRQSLQILHSFAGQGYSWTHILLPTLVIFAPSLAMLTWLNIRLIRSRSRKPIWTLLCVGAGLSPLLVSFLGIDIARWAADAVAASTLVLFVLCRQAQHVPLYVPPRVGRVITLLVLLNVATGDQLMSRTRVNTYPYTDLLVQGGKAAFGRR